MMCYGTTIILFANYFHDPKRFDGSISLPMSLNQRITTLSQLPTVLWWKRSYKKEGKEKEGDTQTDFSLVARVLAKIDGSICAGTSDEDNTTTKMKKIPKILTTAKAAKKSKKAKKAMVETDAGEDEFKDEL